MISIYIHWPFCLKKCPYCDFNSFVSQDIQHNRWTESYIDVITKHYSKLLHNKTITSIFFGGGTPSLAMPDMIYSIINSLKNVSKIVPNAEITLEANPTSVEIHKFKEFKDAGINRVSMGIQSLREDNLKFLGRNHSANDSLAAIEAVKANFHNYSLDFIYALPHQTLDDWVIELSEAILLANGHLSLYQLTIENGTKFGAMARQGLLQEIDENVAADMFEITNEITQKNGFNRYEVSNHAKPGYESQHNLNYWRYGDYLGIGPGAHGRHDSTMTIDIKQPEAWLQSVSKNGNGLDICTTLSESDIRIEKILMGLRTVEGVDEKILNQEAIKQLIDDRFIARSNDGKIYVTSKGILLLNSITMKLVVLP